MTRMISRLYDDHEAAKPIVDRHQGLMWEVGDLMHQWEELQSLPELAPDPTDNRFVNR